MSHIRVPNKLYKEAWEIKRDFLKRHGGDLPLWKAVVDAENNRRVRQKKDEVSFF